MVDVAILDWRAKEGLSEKILFDEDLNEAKGKATWVSGERNCRQRKSTRVMRCEHPQKGKKACAAGEGQRENMER